MTCLGFALEFLRLFRNFNLGLTKITFKFLFFVIWSWSFTTLTNNKKISAFLTEICLTSNVSLSSSCATFPWYQRLHQKVKSKVSFIPFCMMCDFSISAQSSIVSLMMKSLLWVFFCSVSFYESLQT